MKVYYHLFPKLTDSPVVSTADSKPPPKLSFLNYLVSLTLFPVLFKYVLLLAHHRHSHHRPLSTKKHTRRGIKHIWPDSAAIWEANYFPPYIQCQFVRKKKSYLKIYIFSAALCSLTSYPLSSMIIKTLQLFSQRSHVTCFSSLSLFLNSVDFPEVDHPLFFTCLFLVFRLIW